MSTTSPFRVGAKVAVTRTGDTGRIVPLTDWPERRPEPWSDGTIIVRWDEFMPPFVPAPRAGGLRYSPFTRAEAQDLLTVVASAPLNRADATAALAAEFAQIAADKSRFWDELRRANAENEGKAVPDLTEARRLFTAMSDLDRRVDALRTAHFPDAGTLAVQSDETFGQPAIAWTCDPDGENYREVWTAQNGLIADDTSVQVEPDTVDPDDPTAMALPVPGDRVLLHDGTTARVRLRIGMSRVYMVRPDHFESGGEISVTLDEIAGYPEEEQSARSFQAGDPVRVSGSNRAGRVTSVHDGFVWVSLQDEHVRTGWRPANGYEPADVTPISTTALCEATTHVSDGADSAELGPCDRPATRTAVGQNGKLFPVCDEHAPPELQDGEVAFLERNGVVWRVTADGGHLTLADLEADGWARITEAEAASWLGITLDGGAES